MNIRFRYLAEDEEGMPLELWACNECRRNNNNLILLRKWRLIEQSNDEKILCDTCGVGLENKEKAI
ncbi:hypothetical protein ACFL6N_05490 [Thermodesulfobacteriota bacterium]